MAVTAASFLERFPEFEAAGSTLIEASLTDARLMISSSAYGVKYDMAVRFQAAHLLAINPLGEMARLDMDKCGSDATTYSAQLKTIQSSLGLGVRTI
ncbi:MAG: DUF4054 domain-containing protein [Deltaproteobacteria bacterium]|nr:DUF4054 domain-containing protein [Deltaproteobacteria bacterium]